MIGATSLAAILLFPIFMFGASLFQYARQNIEN